MLDHWLSYSLADFIPVGMDVYLNLFSRANNDLWPWTMVAALLGIVVIVLAMKQQVRYCCWLLGVAWCFCAYQFHFNLLSELHWIGYYFAVLFFIQGCLLFLFASIGPKYKRPKNHRIKLGGLIMAIGVVAFLIVPVFSERSWQSTEVFGIAPNPTSWLTLGAFLSLNIRRWWLLSIPGAWLLMSLLMAFAMK